MPREGMGMRRHLDYLDDGPQEAESRPFRFPRKPKKLPATKKRLPSGLAPDPKRYNDEIPDPDYDETLPE